MMSRCGLVTTSTIHNLLSTIQNISTFYFLLSTFLVLAVSCASQKTLALQDAETGKIYGRWPVEDGAEFAIEFVHSVNKSPVRDTFRVQGREIIPVSTRFSGFGAGMQSDLESGQTLSRDGDALVITGFNQSFRELRYIVGTVSDHLFFINGTTLSLRDLCGKNAHLIIRIK